MRFLNDGHYCLYAEFGRFDYLGTHTTLVTLLWYHGLPISLGHSKAQTPVGITVGSDTFCDHFCGIFVELVFKKMPKTVFEVFQWYYHGVMKYEKSYLEYFGIILTLNIIEDDRFEPNLREPHNPLVIEK